jgi:hypothetical protein
MFDKMTTSSLGWDDVEILDGDLLKTAALKLPDGVVYDPDFLYMKVRAVSAGEYWGCNKNSDFFPEGELIQGYPTFLTAHAFKNHENKDIKNTIGDVLSAEWNDKMKGVDLLLRIDRKIAPTIVRGFEKGFMTDVSMGCRINYSVCSICGNKAKTKFEYCDHIKYQRGRILEDGRKIYEINIGPKFHDISTVLNGAEKAAKVTGLFIVGDKVAFREDKTLEKVASFQESISQMIVPDITEKVANEFDTIDLDMNMYKKMDKKAYVQKIAEIKKDLQGKILSAAKGDYINERRDKVEAMSELLKILYEDYWDRDKCVKIANSIKSLATKRGVPVDAALDQFLKVLNFAGIELTPLELHDISCSLVGCNTPDLRKINLVEEVNDDTAHNIAKEVDEVTSENSMSEYMNLPSLFKTISEGFMPRHDKIINLMNNVGDPIKKTKATIVIMKRPVPSVQDDAMQYDIMNDIVKPLLPERSMHRKFLIPRLVRMISNGPVQHPENINHFMPVKMINNGASIHKVASTIPYILSGLMYSTYEDERVASYLSGELQDGINKFANEIYDIESLEMDKVASKQKNQQKNPWKVSKAVVIGVPAAYAYSALQRARIHNGKRVSTANRFAAENPGNLALLQLAFAPAISKGVNKIKNSKGAANVVKTVDDVLYKKFASGLPYSGQEKNASFDNEGDTLYNKDMFKDESIDATMLKKYSREELGVIKQACILMAEQRQDVVNDILFKNALTEDDLEEYLKTASDCIKIEIEKVADEGLTKQIAKNTVGDILFNPEGTSLFATIPGNVIDSFIFSKLFNKSKKGADIRSSKINDVAPTQSLK